MDDNHFKNIFKFLKSESLSENERIGMRNVLRSVMRENPPKSSYSFAHRMSSVLSVFETKTFRSVSFAFALVLVLGVGTSYASSAALPGDPLYAVKVGFTEPIRRVLAVSPVAKAELDSALLSRRLEEAATLAANGDLNDGVRTSIESRIALNAEDFNTSVAKLRTSESGAYAAASAESNLEASLVGHERVLTALSIDLPNEAPSIAPLLHKVRVQAAETNSKRKSAERDLSAKSEITVKAAASDQQKNAREKVRKLRSIAATKRVQASTTIEASTSAQQMENAISVGEQKLHEGNYTEAFGTFQAAIRAARAVEVNLDAEERLAPSVIESKNSYTVTPPQDPTESD